MKSLSNQIPQKNLYINHLSGSTHRARRIRRGELKIFNVLIALFMTFIVFAAMQAFQLNILLSDAKAIEHDVIELRAMQNAISQKYVSYTTDFSNQMRI